MRKLALLLALATLAPFALAACGGDDETTAATSTTTEATTTTQAGGGAGGQISLSADPNGALAYEQSSLSASAGKNTIDFDNQAPVGHDVCVQDPSGKEVGCSDVIQQDKTTLDVDLKPGDYTYFCSVDGHEAAGMKGTLTVK